MSDEMRALEVIESITGDDFCEELDCEVAFRPEALTELEKHIAEKLSLIYRVAHSHLKEAQCYHVHENWREEARSFAASKERL